MRSKTRPPFWLGIFVFVASSLLLISSPQFSKHSLDVKKQKSFSESQLAWFHNARKSTARSSAEPSSAFDPSLVYATLLGGGSANQGALVNVIFVDGPGNTYVGGYGAIQTTPGVVQPNQCQGCLGFLTKIDPSGQSQIFSTYTEGISVTAMAVDGLGNIYVAGQVPQGSVLPIPTGTTPFQLAPSGLNLGILKLNSTATAILAATYLGGSGVEQVGGLAVDSNNNLYIVGNTTSNDFPVTKNPLQSSLGTSGQNVFVTELNSSLSTAVYSTYLGQNSAANVGIGSNRINDAVLGTMLAAGNSSLALDSSGDAYVVGQATSGFPTTSTAVQGTCPTGYYCAFLTKLDPSGSSLLYGTYLGTTPAGASQANTVAVDGLKNIYIGGTTNAGYPTTPGAFQPCNAASNYSQGFVSEINPSGALVFSTCLGNNGSVVDLVVDSAQNVDRVGSSDASLPLQNPIQTTPGITFVASISPNSTPPVLRFSSYIGSGNTFVGLSSVGVDSTGNISGAGTVNDEPESFPVFNALQPVAPIGPLILGFLMRISPTDAPADALWPGALVFPVQQVGTPSSPQTINLYDLGSVDLTVSNVTATGDFSVQNNCTTTVAPAGGTCTLLVTYTPKVVGTSNGTLTITDNSAGSPRSVQLTGQGAVASVNVAPSSLSFPSHFVGTTSTGQMVTLTNPGPLTIQISHITTTGDFAETNNCGNLITPNGSCTLTVTFTPTATGNRTGTLNISDNAQGSPQIVALSGTGGNPSLGLGMATGSSSSATFSAGANVTFTLSIGGDGMGGTASLTCSGAPSTVTCTVPSSVPFAANTASTFTAFVTTTARTQAAVRPGAFWRATWAWGLTLIGCVFLATVPPLRSRMSYLGLLALFALALSSCGGGSSSPQSGGTMVGTPAGTYTLVVTATSGSTTQTQNLTLVVQ